MTAPGTQTAPEGTVSPAEMDEILSGLQAFLRDEVRRRHEDAGIDLSDPIQVFEPNGRFNDQVLGLMREVREASARAGYYTMLVPAELGGGGLGFAALYQAWELIYRECGAHHWLGYQAVGHWARGPSHVLLGAAPTVRDTLLPELLSGTKTLCFAMSEPDAGSDAWRMRTTATPTADGGWLIDGTKQWITNGPYADAIVVFAVTDLEAARAHRGGVSAFLVPADAPGVRVDSVIKMFGHHGGDEAILSFAGVEVGPDQLLGNEGDGFGLAMSGASAGRLYNSARAVGLGRWALRMATEYTSLREAFGRPIIENQGVSFPLADSAIELRAARLVGLDCAARLDRGESARADLAIAKTFSTEVAVRVLDRAMQAHGAMGFTNETGLSEAWQQVRRICVADGTSEILRRQIVKSMRSGELEA